jgi:hypothetical protein
MYALQLGGNGVSCDGATALAAALKQCKCSLTTLSLRSNEVSGAGALALAEAACTRKLKGVPMNLLDLSGNGGIPAKVASQALVIGNPAVSLDVVWGGARSEGGGGLAGAAGAAEAAAAAAAAATGGSSSSGQRGSRGSKVGR